jgi:hypothetical protein
MLKGYIIIIIIIGTVNGFLPGGSGTTINKYIVNDATQTMKDILHTMNTTQKKKKKKKRERERKYSYPCNRLWRPIGCEMMRIPHCLDLGSPNFFSLRATLTPPLSPKGHHTNIL